MSAKTGDKVTDSVWFTPMGGAVIGIVLVETVYDGPVFYIGQGAGFNREHDEDRIMKTGARFPWRAGAELFGRDIEEKQA